MKAILTIITDFAQPQSLELNTPYGTCELVLEYEHYPDSHHTNAVDTRQHTALRPL